MADNVTAQDKGGGEARTIIPEEQTQAVLADVIDLGMRKTQFKGEDPYLQHRVALVFQSADVDPKTGRRYEVHQEFTNSMGKKANLRGFIESWRGKKLTQEEARKGVQLAALVGVNALISPEHQTSKRTGKPYAIIAAIAPLPKTMARIQVEGYERAPFWEDRKKEYAETARLVATTTGPDSYLPGDFPENASDLEDEDDDLPF